MRRLTILALVGLVLLSGCSRDPETKDGLTARQQSQLDNAAAMLGDQEIDTSPDSLVPEEANVIAGETVPRANAAAPLPANSAAPRR